MKIKNLVIIFLAIVIFVLIASYFIFLRQGNQHPPQPKVVVIGLDGADWRIINPLLKEGLLPNLKYLMDEGSYGVLKTIKPTKSAVIWTSIATGKGMLKHGILDWAYLRKNKILVPYSRAERKVKAIWNILSEQDLKVGVINWFCTFPPEEVNGYMVSDRFRIGSIKEVDQYGLTYPNALAKKINWAIKRGERDYNEIVKEEKLSDFRKMKPSQFVPPNSGTALRIKRFKIFVLQDKTIEEVSLHLFRSSPTDFFATYLRLIDETSHFAANFLDKSLIDRWEKENKEGGLTEQTRALLNKNMSQILKPIYSYLDRVVGKFIKLADKNTTFIVISDHGFEFYNGGYDHYNCPGIPHGIIIMKGPNVKKNYRIKDASIFDITPTVLYLFDLPTAKDMDGKVLFEIFKDKFLNKRKSKWIDSYETTKDKFKKEEKKISPLDKEALDELKSLGYIK